MDTCTKSQGSQMKPKISVKKENISEGLLSSVKSVLQSRKELCSISDCLKSGNKEDFIEITFLGLSRESGIRNLQGVTALYVDVPELIQSPHLCNLNENEVVLMKDGKEASKSSATQITQNLFSGSVCMMTLPPFSLFKSDYLYVLLSKYSAGVRYAIDQDCLNMNKKADHHEDDDTNHSVSSIEDDFVTAFEHLDEEDPINTTDSLGMQWGSSTNQRDVASQTQPPHCLDISGTKIIFSSMRRRSSIKSTVLMSYLGHQDISSLTKNDGNTSYDGWTRGQDKHTFSPSPTETSESECSSPSPIIFLDEEGYQKSLRAKLILPKIPVGKDGVEDSDSELSEFFDSFDRFDDLDPNLEDHLPTNNKPILASPPKKRKNAKVSVSTVCMNPQKFKFECPTLSASIKKPTPRKAESPFSSTVDLPESPRPAKTCTEDNGSLFSPIRSSAFSPPGFAIGSEVLLQTASQHEAALCKDNSYAAFNSYANRVCADMFDSVLKTKPSSELIKKEPEKVTRIKRKSNGKESERKMKTKHKSIKGGIQKFATDLVEKSFGSAFKDLQRGVTSCTSALCHLAARLTSYVFQMAFYEIGRRQAFSIKKRAINGLANLMVSEVMTSALQELRYIKKQMVTNAVTRFAADLAEELVFEGIMEVCQFSHPPTPLVSSDTQYFDYEDVAVSSYAKDLSESVIQEAFIELSQVNVTFTTEAAISVSMDNLKYVGSEGIIQSTQSSSSLPSSVHNSASSAAHESKKDFTVHYALLFTSGLMSSVPVPVAAKVLSQHAIPSDHTDMSTNNMCINNADHYQFPSKDFNELPSDKNILSLSKNCVTSSRQEQRYVDFIKEDADGINPFSVTMVDMIVNEAYDVIKSSRTVENYAEMMTKRIIEIPSPHPSLGGGGSSLHQFADDMACRLSSGKNVQSISNRLDATTSNQEISLNLVGSQLNSFDQVEHASRNPSLSSKPFAIDCKSVSSSKHASVTFLGSSNNGNSKACLGGLSTRRSIENNEALDLPLFGLQSCLPHINSFSSVVCGCGDDFFMEDRNSHKGSNVTLLPGVPPSTPLVSYERSPERSMRKLSKRLKGQLAKEFYPATPPSTPHLSAYENNNMKKDDFMLTLMRSLSEEVESSSSDESYEEFEVSEETCRYAEYLSSNIISIATDMAAYSLVDDSVQGPPKKNKSQLSMLSDKWGYPAYMRNITEELLESLCSYANCVAGDVISDAKEVLGSRKNSCDLEYSISQKSDKDCRPKERGHNYTNFKSSDAATLSLPHHCGGSGLTSKYPSCESVTEEYADHLIRVLKMEGGSSELILDQYASRLAYRAIKSGLQQASKAIKLKSNRKIMPRLKTEASSNKDLFRLLGRTHNAGKDNRRQSNVILHSLIDDSAHKAEFNRLIHFAESLANTITYDVKKRLKMSAASLPKSLTDSCLYTKSKNDYVNGDIVKTSFPKTPLLFSHKQKLYHSTGSLNDNGYSENFVQAIEQYACKVVDSTLEFSLERARLQVMENRRKADKDSNAVKLVHSYGTACRLCSAKEQQGNPLSSCHFLLGHDVSRKIKQSAKSKQNTGQKSRLFHLNIPKIQIDLDKRAMFADKIVSAAIEKAERELSSTSLAGDSGIGHDGVSFAESLTTEILMSAMKNIGHVVNISSIGKDGFQSVDSVTSQQTSVSIGDDSTGSWSNLSFEDEHQDESSSFLHLSDSNGNSSSWSSLGLEGDMCEENLSFPPSDSDGAEEKDKDHKLPTEVVQQQRRILLIRNVDMGPSTVESQLRTILQWIAASECDISELYFPDNAIKDLLLLFRRIRERGWKIGDLFQAVLQYCESSEMSSDLPNSLFIWLLEKVI